jgi:teichuronic acid biosynthesis glycosyltransferase TuaC
LKILFISSGNGAEGISPIIKNQGESLANLGHSVEYYLIKGKGIFGYLKNVFPLYRFLRKNKYDACHAHFLWSAIIATLSFAKPLTVSLMGSDVKRNRIVSKLFSFFWKVVIVKSEDMKISGKINKAVVLPNGVDFQKFRPISKMEALDFTKWDLFSKHILFAADPANPIKNYILARKAFDLLDSPKTELHFLKNQQNEHVPYYLNSADVVILTSMWEGSPNVIKEAMACNRPIVCTDCGDVKNVIGKTNGCFVTSYNAAEICASIKKALGFKETTGRSDIPDLDSEKIAKILEDLYRMQITTTN